VLPPDEVPQLLSQSPDIHCEIYPMPTFFKHCSHILLPTTTNILNLSLSTGIFPDQFKNCTVHPYLKKKYNLGKDDYGNYGPISHPPFMSKLTERVVKLRLADYLSTNNFLNSFQYANFKHQSMETTLL